MSIFIIRPPLQESGLAAMREAGELVLPLPVELGDLSAISGLATLKRHLRGLFPDAPPEHIATLAEQANPLLFKLQPEDLVAVKLDEKNILIGEVTGELHYRDGAHRIPMQWLENMLRLSAFGKQRCLFDADQPVFFEVIVPKVKQRIRQAMPYRYNRFGKWTWLLGVFFAMRLALRILRLWRREFNY